MVEKVIAVDPAIPGKDYSGWLCDECGWFFPATPGNVNRIPPTEHGHRWKASTSIYNPPKCKGSLNVLYTAPTIRKAFNDLATHLANQPTHCFCDVEARRRAKEW